MKKTFVFLLAFYSLVQAQVSDGKSVFETYCWGCHHQSAEAFGPAFTTIANKRSKEEIMAYILEPQAMYKAFGYKRTVMSQLKLSDAELNAIANYILSYKGK
jgi:cytochrome c553